MKTCTKCNNERPVSDFHFKNRATGKRRTWCRFCVKKYHRNHYLNNKEAYYRQKMLRRIEVKKLIYKYLEDHPCADCGESDPVVLEFDHNDSDEKLMNISAMVARDRSYKVIMAEIEKCTVRCANCHRRKTAKDHNWYQWLVKLA